MEFFQWELPKIGGQKVGTYLVHTNEYPLGEHNTECSNIFK